MLINTFKNAINATKSQKARFPIVGWEGETINIDCFFHPGQWGQATDDDIENLKKYLDGEKLMGTIIK